MFFLDELQDIKIYRKKFLLPINDKNKRKNSVAMLLTPSYESSKRMMTHPLFVNKYFNSYYIERAALYYVNGSTIIEESAEPVLENINDIISRDNNRTMLYSGYESDTFEVMKFLNISTIDSLNKDYNIDIDYPISVEVFRKYSIPHTTKTTINVASKSAFNKNLKNYGAYLRYCAMEFLLMNSKFNIPNELKYAISLYESDLYFIHKNNWIFSDELQRLCIRIDNYIEKHGHKKFASIVRKGQINDLFSAEYVVGTMISATISKVFGFLEETSTIVTENYKSDYFKNDSILQIGESCLFVFQEGNDTNNTVIKKLLYNDRIKNLKEMQDIYEKVKEENDFIKYTYNKLEMYKGLNLFIDFSRYNESFIRNNTYKLNRGYEIYLDLMDRLINDKRLKANGYNVKTVIIPIIDWDMNGKESKLWMIQNGINPISCIYQTLYKNPAKMKTLFGDITFLFMGANGYFKINFSTVDMKSVNQLFIRNIKLLRDKKYVPEDETLDRQISAKAITVDIVDKVEKSQGVTIDDISAKKDDNTETKSNKVKTDTKDKEDKNEGTDKNKENKDEIVSKVAKAAAISTTVDDTLDTLDNDEKLKQILADLAEDPDDKSNISAARASRMVKLQNDLMEKEFKGKPLKELLAEDNSKSQEPLKEVKLNVATVNDEWNHLTYCSSFDQYNPDEDIVKIFNSFADMNPPLSVISIEAEDTSTSEDIIETYTVKYEDINGKRYTIKLDVPLFIDNKYMKLRGNRKDISSQLFLMPIIKTGEDTVQIVSNYNKIFIRRFGTTSGKSIGPCDRLIKTITKHKFKNLKIVEGDNSKICSRYELPIDYVDLATIYNKFITPDYTVYFNQEELRNLYGDKIDEGKGIPYAVVNKSKEILYYDSEATIDGKFVSFAYWLALLLGVDKELSKENFTQLYEKATPSIRYTYSKASILNTEIPVIVICAYSEGLKKTLDKAGINYTIADNKKGIDLNTQDFIRFKDAYLIYDLDYASSLLLNGLKACDTASYSIGDMNSKSMYLDFLDDFGGRIKADGLDNFYNLMVDKPITVETLKYYKLPTDYIEILLYANRLLADNKFIKHTNLTDNRRIRRNEQIPAMLYTVMARAYGQYSTQMKHGRSGMFSVKQSALIDEVLLNSTTSDKSIINALSEYEAYTIVTAKGPSGMNSDRSYTLDKRSYDESMIGVLGMSTGFAGNVGVSRQATIDANVSTVRGYITNKNKLDENVMSVTKSLCMTEALTPYGSTRDDPFRTAMTYVQTSKHYMRSRRANPSLITTGADEALPYLISNIFAKKADKSGKVISLNDERMIVEYKDGTKDYIDLSTNVEKNSSSGFYVTLKLDTDLKEGSTFKAGEILAYDKESFSNELGESGNIAYNIGTITKVAILNTDEGFEDSAIISEDLSEAMTSDVILMCPNHPIILPKDTNIYNMVKVGQKIEEGDTLLTIQTPYDEEDANILLRNLIDDEDEISELGRRSIKSKVTGVVQDIELLRCVDKDELSPSLKKLFNDYERNINRRKKEMDELNIAGKDFHLGATDKLPPVGELKNASDGVAIKIYLKYEDKMSVGDKLIYYSANKGVIKGFFPKGDEPRGNYRPNEKIHSVTSCASINARKVCSILVVGSIYKYLVELDRHCKDILGIKYQDNLFD